MKSTKSLAILIALVGALACSACRPPTDPTFIQERQNFKSLGMAAGGEIVRNSRIAAAR